jgi:signal recognition particle GTPase
MEQEDKDVEEVLDAFREKLEDILGKTNVGSQLTDKIVKGILPQGDLEIIEGNPSISQELQSFLVN